MSGIPRADAPRLVVLNGPPGVGKSSVARQLRDLRPGTVAIEGDALRAFVSDQAKAHLGGGSTYRAAGALAGTYFTMGAARVVFDYVFLRPSHVAHFVEAAPDGVFVHLFTLWAPLDVVVAREASRAGRDRLGDAVRECYIEIRANLAELGLMLDAAKAVPDDLAARIDALVAEGAGVLRAPPGTRRK